MTIDPMAQSLALLRRLGGSELVAKLGLRRPAQRLAYFGTREGFKAVGVVARSFKAAQRLLRPERLPSASRASDLFDLTLSEEQQLIRDTVQRFARELMRKAAADADTRRAPPDGFAKEFAELGIAQLAIPEALGGAAAESGELTQALVAEDLACGDMGLAVAALAPVGVANALARWGSADQQSRYLPAFAETEPPVAALAVAERRAVFDPRHLRTRARFEAGGFVLDGEKTLVPRAEAAELFLVAADLVGHGPALFLVEAGTAGLAAAPEPAMGVRAASLGRLTLDGVHLGPGALLGERPDAVDYTALLDRAGLAWCALAVGTAQAVLDYTTEYCNGRIAFGEPITHRQSVAFLIADLAIELEAMRLLTWRAACRAEEGRAFHREAYLARVLCLEKARRIATDGVQLLGGHGYIKDHPVERWYRDLMAVGVMEGGLLL